MFYQCTIVAYGQHPHPLSIFSTAISSCSHLYCAWQCNFSFRNPRNFPMPQRINAPMRQCCAFAMCQCMNVSMFRCQCFNVQTTNGRNVAIANWIERSVSPPDSPLLNVALAQCCWRPAPSPMYLPWPQYPISCYLYISYILSTASIPLLLVSCPMSLAPCVTHFMFLVFPVPGSYVACLMSFVYPVPRLLFPLIGFVSLVLCPMSPRPPPVPSH